MSCHIGSQILDTEPMLEAFDKMIALVERLRAARPSHPPLDLGGGLGVPYKPGDASAGDREFIQAHVRRKPEDSREW